MKRPNLFILGAPKCGTTSLAFWLSQHSQVFVSPVKEPHHFYSPHHPKMPKVAYEKLFEGAEKYKIVAESSVWYLFGNNVAIPKIEEYCKSDPPKYIVCIRNPVDMALSLHAQKVFSGNELLKDFMSAWRAGNQREKGNMFKVFGIPTGDPAHMSYRHSCKIGSQIESLLKLVPEERVHFVLLDDIVKDPQSVWTGVQNFLGVELESLERFENKNPATVRKHPALHRAMMLMSLLKQRLGFSRPTGLLLPLLRKNVEEKPYAKLESHERSQIRESFEKEIDKIKIILNRNIDW